MNGKFCLDANCTCPFNVADEDYINPKLCKHIYATYMTIYELENKEYLKNAMTEYSEKYSSLYLDITNKIDNLKLNSKDKNFCKKYKEERINCKCSYINYTSITGIISSFCNNEYQQ